MDKLYVVGVQILNECATNVDEVRQNVNRAATLISNHAQTFHSSSNTIYLLPELSSSGYGSKAFQNLDTVAEDSYGLSFKCFSVLAQKYACYICYGFPRKQSGKFYISQAVVSPQGKLLVVYDKVHICQFGDCVEKQYFSPQLDTQVPVFSVNNVNFGIAICYDLRFPEYTRKLAIDHQIHVLLHPGGWPRDAGFITWHTFVITRAVENQIYIASINRASNENGASIFCPPMIDDNYKPTLLGTEEGILVGEISLDFVSEIRKIYNFRGDRLSKY